MRNGNYILILLLLLLGCKPSTQGTIIDEEDIVPPAPPFWAYFTIEGVDSDADGVRDDFELYVNERFTDPNLRKALKYRARLYGKLMRSPSKVEINELFREMIYIVPCITFFSKGQNMDVVEVGEAYLDNPWRRSRFNEQARVVTSFGASGSNGSVMHNLNRCPFEIINLKDYLKEYLPKEVYKKSATEEEVEQFENIMGIKQ